MSIKTIIICAVCFVLQTIRRGAFHTNVFSVYDPIYDSVFDSQTGRFQKKKCGEKLLCVICFIAVCALITITAKKGFRVGASEIRWGIGLGVFCVTWPYVVIYRLYAFRKNPAAAVHLLINILEIVYAVRIADFFLTRNAFDLFVLPIPAAGGLLRGYTDERRPYYQEQIFFQTKLYIAWKKIKLREPRFVEKYGVYIKAACEKYRLPETFLTRLMLIDEIEYNTWYSVALKRLAYSILPFCGIMPDCSLGPGSIKPSTVKAYVDVSDKELIRMLQSPKENINLLARHIRTLTDNYPGAGNYITEETRKGSPCGAVEYDALDDTAQLCRYIVCQYRAGVACSRKEFADICTEILLHSEADKVR